MSIKNLIQKYQTLLKYMLTALTGSIFNLITAYSLYIVFNKGLIFSNTCGLIVGFLLTFIGSKLVFGKKYSIKGFLVYLGSFLLGMLMANIIINYAFLFFNKFLRKRLAFLTSKVLSGILPFTTSYAIRRLVFKGNFV
ncbi:MAG: hypothetical protein Q4E36_02915 [Bacillota bacterium]|nr:hypothetical protein [Bacillota bacterium]